MTIFRPQKKKSENKVLYLYNPSILTRTKQLKKKKKITGGARTTDLGEQKKGAYQVLNKRTSMCLSARTPRMGFSVTARRGHIQYEVKISYESMKESSEGVAEPIGGTPVYLLLDQLSY